MKKFTNGTIYKPVAIPDSYEKIDQKKPGLGGAIYQFLSSQVMELRKVLILLPLF